MAGKVTGPRTLPWAHPGSRSDPDPCAGDVFRAPQERHIPCYTSPGCDGDPCWPAAGPQVHAEYLRGLSYPYSG